MAHEIWIAGYPGIGGGADVELDHLLDLFEAQGVRVHLVPFGAPDEDAREDCDARGFTTHAYDPGIFAGKIVLSFCCGPFLAQLHNIMREGPPARVLWANCMTYNFDAELAAHRNGWITHNLFQSKYQRARVLPKLLEIGPVRELEGYRPFFSQRLWQKRGGCLPCGRRPEFFGVGRLSRDDGDKYHAELWDTFQKIESPHRPLKAYVLGFGGNARSKCGDPPPQEQLLSETWPHGGIKAGEFFGRIDVLLHLTGGSRENWPMSVKEAFASGRVPVVDDDFGVAEMIEHGVDGFKAKTPDEAAAYVSKLAGDPDLLRAMAAAGGRTLEREHCNAELCFAPFEKLFLEAGEPSAPPEPAPPRAETVPAPAAPPATVAPRAPAELQGIPAAVLEKLRTAHKSGRYAVAIFEYSARGDLDAHVTTVDFPFMAMSEAVRLLRQDLQAKQAKGR